MSESEHSASDSDRGPEKVVQAAKCKAPACDFVAVVEDPETVYDASLELADHLNEDHDDIDREIAIDRSGEWDEDHYKPVDTETGEPLDTDPTGGIRDE